MQGLFYGKEKCSCFFSNVTIQCQRHKVRFRMFFGTFIHIKNQCIPETEILSKYKIKLGFMISNQDKCMLLYFKFLILMNVWKAAL